MVIVDQGKSSEWIMAQFGGELSGLSHDIVFPKDLEAYLRQNESVVDILRMDDAIYSGEQLSRFGRDSHKLIKDLPSTYQIQPSRTKCSNTFFGSSFHWSFLEILLE